MSQAGIVNSTVPPIVATNYVADAGAATPAANILNVITPAFGTNGITTTAAGNTITISLTDFFFGSGVTTDATPLVIATGACGAVPGVYAIHAKVSALDVTDTLGVAYALFGGVRTTGAAAVLLPNQELDEFEENVTVGAATAAITVSGNNYEITVTGIAGKTFHWKVVGDFVFGY